VTFGDDSATQTTAIFSAVGTYVLRLQADDGELTTSDELTITVTPPPNQAPEADAGADLITIVSKTTNLSGTVRDDGLPDLPGKLTTGWTKVSGPGTVTFRDAAAAQTTAIFNAAGTYVLRLQTGDGALTASDDVTITVTGPGGNRRPEVNAGPDQTVVVLKPLNLRGVIRDDGLPKLPGKLTGAWTKVSGPGTVKFAKASAASTAAIFSAPGAYVLRLQANDGALTASDEVAITVLPPLPNQAPVVNAGVDQNLIATKVTTLNGIVRDDGLPKRPGKVAATWTKVSGPGSVTFARAASPITAASFGVPGSYVLRLAASDGVLRASDEVAVTVTAATNLAPSVSAGPDLTVLVTAATALHPSVQDDGLPQPTGKVKTTWSKVKGTGSVTFANPSAADTTVRFSATGVYVLRLTADDGLLKTTDDVTINVKRRLSPVAAMLAVRGAPGSDAVDTLLAGRQLADLMFDI
jgi:hypothetical protein